MNFYSIRGFIVICSILVPVSCVATLKKKTEKQTLEDQYVEHFGNDPIDLKVWYTVRNWWYMKGEPSLRKFCAEVHELTGNGRCVVDFVLYKSRMLNLTNSAHVNRKIDVVEYSVERANKTSRASTTESWKMKKGGKRWYISEGLKYECIFTLKLINKEDMEFRLDKHVCGISDISPFTTQNIEDLLKDVSSFEGGPGMSSAEKAMGTPSDNE